MDLEGKVAIVTGGASGLGEATVEAYVARGVCVAIFDMNEDRAAAVIERLGSDNVAFFHVNVSDEDSVKAAVAAVVERFGALHICNNFAGIGSASKPLASRAFFLWTNTCASSWSIRWEPLTSVALQRRPCPKTRLSMRTGAAVSSSTPRRLPPMRANWPASLLGD